MSESPMLTVILPVYNAEKFLELAISSVLNQTFKNFELLIINDGSTDESDKIIGSFNDSRIRYTINEENIKLIRTLNKGIDLAKGKYLARMDADDICLPTRFQRQINYLEKNPNVGVCGTHFITFNEDGEEHLTAYSSESHEIKFNLLRDCHFCHPTIMFRKSVLENPSVRYNLTYPHAEDYKLWIELSEKTEFHNIPTPLLKYRHHSNNISKLNEQTQLTASKMIRKEYFQKLGITISGNQLETFNEFSYSGFNLTYKDIDGIVGVLNNLASNPQTLISRNTITKKLGDLWVHFVANSTWNANQLWSTTKRLSFLPSSIRVNIILRILFKWMSTVRQH
jgi:glycosyltransferase involved in cell wall biosynthesis